MMTSGEEARKMDLDVGVERAEDDSGMAKLPSTEENLKKMEESESQVTPKVDSEVSSKTEESKDIAKGCSIASELKESSVDDNGKTPSESKGKDTGDDDKSSVADSSESSQPSSDGKSTSYESARSSLQSSSDGARSYESVRGSSPEGNLDKMGSKSEITVKVDSEANLKTEEPKKSKDVAKGCSVASELKKLAIGDNSKTPSESKDKSAGDDERSLADSSKSSQPSSEGKSTVYESARSSVQSSCDGLRSYESVRGSSPDGNLDGYVKFSMVDSSSSFSLSPSLCASSLEESLKALSRSMGSVDSAYPEDDAEKASSGDAMGESKDTTAVESTDGSAALGDEDQMQSPVTEGTSSQKRKAAQSGSTKRFLGMTFSYKSSDKPKTPKVSSESDKTKSPKTSEGLDESFEKIKSPKKSKSPRKSKSPEPKGSKKCSETGETKTDTPKKLSCRKSFLQAVGSPINKIFQKLSPGDSKRHPCSSTCDPDLQIKSPHLSPISHNQKRVFLTSYVGNMFLPNFGTDRIDYSKLAEERIVTTYLTSHECYDVMPISGKVIVLSVDLLVKNAFSALVTNEIKAAPLWDSGLHDFVGFLTISDFINVLRHYYYSSPEDIKDIENQSISTWRRITQVPNRFIKINGSNNLAEAARLLTQEGVHRIPVFDEKRQCVLFVLTRKRLLQFLNYYLFDKLEQFKIKTLTFFKKTVREVGVGTYENIATVSENTKVIDALNLFVEREVSSLPVVDEDGVLKDIFGKMDVFALAKEQMYHNLEITVYEVVRKGVPRECAVICTLDESLGVVIQRFISTKSHRIVVINERRSVVGIISLSDLLKFLVLEPLDAAAGSASDTIEEGVEGAVGGADGDSVFNDSVNVTGESDKDESLAVKMEDLNVNKDEEPVAEDVSKSE